MQVTTYGTRGSIPVSGADFARYGGNTTCVQVASQCLPGGEALAIDLGTGFVPLSRKLLGEKVMKVNVLMTHYHHDHTMGATLAPHTFIPAAQFTVWGPKEHGVGAGEVFEQLFKPPFFPVEFATLRHRFRIRDLEHIGTQALVIHPMGGAQLIKVDELARLDGQPSGRKEVVFHGGRGHHDLKECLVIKMWKTQHPEYTVSYRFEERPTGKVFVFLTDHEKTAAFPLAMLQHLDQADLLIQDGQYSEERYRLQTAGYGHGTPEYCVDAMTACVVGRLGLTHHDPTASDVEIEMREREAQGHYSVTHDDPSGAYARERIFACRDLQEITV